MAGVYNQSINQSINQFISCHSTKARATVWLCRIKEKCLKTDLKLLTDGAVRQFSGREFQSLAASTEKRRAAVTKLCGGTDRSKAITHVLSATHTRTIPAFTPQPQGVTAQ